MGFTVAIAGVTGAVGQDMLQVLERRNFPVDELRPLASKRSVGKTVSFRGQDLTVAELTEEALSVCDLALFSASSSVSKTFRPICEKLGCLMVDNSSAFRMDDSVPLVVPEVNPDDAKSHSGVIANPNCTTIIMLTALAPLHREVAIERIHAASYQAASGAGQACMDELVASTRAVLDDQPFEPSVLPFPYGFNLFLHNSPWNSELRYCQEELKMVNESRKMLHMPDLRVHATCVRVPIPRTHAETLNVTFSDELSVERAYELLADAPGVTVLDDEAANRWAMPIDVAGKDDVYVSRIRKDLSLDRTLDLWVVGDQLLKGAALNAVQCAELALDCAPA